MYLPIGLLTTSQSQVIRAVVEKKIIYTTEEVIHSQYVIVYFEFFFSDTNSVVSLK